ncbi:MAG: ParB/RepB/Spo0J family partition protein [Chitinispirillia bacterium]|nr:ParB/RepB/Spo0J family partition protein [Chitinispirillia bacterium]MCL2268499.1 ParB/RepB/Spo0J family partition protein [Chitinispirillia bacterium]
MNNLPKSGSKRKPVLGRGLSTLIPTISEDGEQGDGAGSGDVQLVDINAIDPNPYQPRVDFDEEEIAGLAASIQNQGLLQPVVLRKKGDRYEIISGERRFRAHRHLKRDSVPCIVKTQVTDKEMLELALVENIQREELNEIEKAAAYQKLIQEFSYTHEELAAQVGKSRAVITNSMRLLNLPDEILQMVRKNEISSGHARAILAVEGAEAQLEAARKVLEDKLTVRDVEYIAQLDKAKKPSKSAPKPQYQLQDANIVHQLERLQYKFGTSVKLKVTGDDKGRVEIDYFSESDLVRIFDLLLNETVLDDVSIA